MYLSTVLVITDSFS